MDNEIDFNKMKFTIEEIHQIYMKHFRNSPWGFAEDGVINIVRYLQDNIDNANEVLLDNIKSSALERCKKESILNLLWRYNDDRKSKKSGWYILFESLRKAIRIYIDLAKQIEEERQKERMEVIETIKKSICKNNNSGKEIDDGKRQGDNGY